jgi:chromosome segregation ATPase
LGAEKLRLASDVISLKRRLTEQIKQTQTEIDSKQFELRGVESNIADRKLYAEEQERLISESADKGNEELHVINYQIEELARNKQDIENEIYGVNQTLISYANQEEQLREQFNQDRANIEHELEGKHSELKSVERVLGEVKLKSQALTQEINIKLTTLREKEESLMARENALRVTRADIELRSRRLNSNERLYS